MTELDLRKEVAWSNSVADKTGKHTDRLGYMIIKLCDITIGRLKGMIPDYLIDDIRQEACYNILKKINAVGAGMCELTSYKSCFLKIAYRTALAEINDNKKYKDAIEFVEDSINDIDDEEERCID